MKRIQNRYMGTILIFLSLTLTGSNALAAPFDFLVNQISKSDYQGYVGSLVGFGSRNLLYTSGNTYARNYIHDQFSGFGMTVAYDDFLYEGNTYQNVVGTIPGTTKSDDIYLLGAHFDSMPGGAVSPGADDNASGVAALLEIASVLSQYEFESTVKFVAFNAEEQGLRGSMAFANEAKGNNDKIKAMINFDMIAYTGGSPSKDLEIMGNDWLVDALSSNALLYVDSLLSEKHYGDVYGSDHYYFHSSQYQGSASILLIENTPSEIWGGSNPYYHKTTDLPGNLDYDFAWDVTKAGAVTMADIAGIYPVPVPAAFWLLGSALICLAGCRRKSGKSVTPAVHLNDGRISHPGLPCLHDHGSL